MTHLPAWLINYPLDVYRRSVSKAQVPIEQAIGTYAQDVAIRATSQPSLSSARIVLESPRRYNILPTGNATGVTTNLAWALDQIS